MLVRFSTLGMFVFWGSKWVTVLSAYLNSNFLITNFQILLFFRKIQFFFIWRDLLPIEAWPNIQFYFCWLCLKTKKIMYNRVVAAIHIWGQFTKYALNDKQICRFCFQFLSTLTISCGTGHPGRSAPPLFYASLPIRMTASSRRHETSKAIIGKEISYVQLGREILDYRIPTETEKPLLLGGERTEATEETMRGLRH